MPSLSSFLSLVNDIVTDGLREVGTGKAVVSKYHYCFIINVIALDIICVYARVIIILRKQLYGLCNWYKCSLLEVEQSLFSMLHLVKPRAVIVFVLIHLLCFFICLC